MKLKKLEGLDGRLDELWKDLVKLRAGHKCEVCFNRNGYVQLHSHHIYHRGIYSTRWVPQNGVCLCASHHFFSCHFSAHKTPSEFREWLYETKGPVYMGQLGAMTRVRIGQGEKKFLLKQLQKEIESYSLK